MGGLEYGILELARRRDALLETIETYRSWLREHGDRDALQTPRLAELSENLRNERLTLAFVAEFSRGKTELINALFFADFKQRLLPSDVGRTTMCPTEIRYDPGDDACIRLLPIESRLRDESIGTLKLRLPEWKHFALDTRDPAQIVATLRKLGEVKSIPEGDARTLGLWDDEATVMAGAPDGLAEVPAWRYAIINFPHPWLESGLTILDTPGLNALGAEPELTLSVIPNAHAVLFLLGADTGVTRSDMEIWTKFLRDQISHHLIVLNKVDILWDELKSWPEIEASIARQISDTARMLGVPENQVLAISAQKALVGKIRGDGGILARSGIGALESILCEEVLPKRQEVLQQGVIRELTGMVETTRQAVEGRAQSLAHDFHQLTSSTGTSRQAADRLVARILEDRRLFDEAVEHYKIAEKLIAQRSEALLSHLSPRRLRDIIDAGLEAVRGSLTTAGLTRGMRALLERIAGQFDEVESIAGGVRDTLEIIYVRFYDRYGFAQTFPPPLDLDRHRMQLARLVDSAESFFDNPSNFLLGKQMLLRKFYVGVVAQAKVLFEQVRRDAERWFRIALDPLAIRIPDRRAELEARLEQATRMSEDVEVATARVVVLKEEIKALAKSQAGIEAVYVKLTAVKGRELY
jgi:hypothetical protein